MNALEKTYSIFAVLFAAGLIVCLILFQELRELNSLLAICSVGFVINIGLMFIVLRDIFLRPFSDPNKKYIWLALVLLFWPAIIYYLPQYGFHPRTGKAG